MKSLKFVLLFIFIFSCTTQKTLKDLKGKELEKAKLEALRKVRPLLVSDEFQFMGCKEITKIQVQKDRGEDREIWKTMGDLKLRRLALLYGGNILRLSMNEIGNQDAFSAVVYKCDKVADATKVIEVGMCKASEQRLFVLKFNKENPREIGEEVLKQKVRYYAISNYYKSFSFKDLKYSYTQQEFRVKTSFYKCK